MKQSSSNQDLENIQIKEKYCGPPKSGNGGYIAGLAANQIKSQAAVIKIKSPAPLNESLYYSRNPNTSEIKLINKGTDLVIAEAKEDNKFYLAVPELLSLEEIRNPQTEYLGFQKHPFPTCFVCGPQRDEEDGMRIFAAKISDQPGFAYLHGAFWNPWKELSDADGEIRREILWAALDCPGGFAVSHSEPTMIVLARLRGRLLASAYPDVPYAIQAWEISRDRRRRLAGTAIYRISDRKCIAYSEGLWMIPGNWHPENQTDY